MPSFSRTWPGTEYYRTVSGPLDISDIVMTHELPPVDDRIEQLYACCEGRCAAVTEGQIHVHSRRPYLVWSKGR
jgi:hypothetical protein